MARIFVCNWYFEQSVVTIAAYRLCEADYELKSHLADVCLLSSYVVLPMICNCANVAIGYCATAVLKG